MWFKTSQKSQYSLQSRDDAAAASSRSRSRSWGSRSTGDHPVAVGISSMASHTIHVHSLHLFLRGGRSDFMGATGEGQRRRRSEGTSLLRIRRVSRKRVHIGQAIKDQRSRIKDQMVQRASCVKETSRSLNPQRWKVSGTCCRSKKG